MGKIEKAGKWAAARASEASTWKGIGWLLVAAGIVPIGAVDGVVALGVGLVGLVEIVRKEVAK